MISISRQAFGDAASTSSIFKLLFKQTKQVDPQDDDTSIATKEEEQQLPLTASKQPTLLADLHLLQQLTQQLQAATLDTASGNNDDDNEDSQSTVETENLATLYCRRAAALLAFVDHDAATTVPLNILASSSDDANQPPMMLEAVRQALQDAQAAVTLTLSSATSAEALLLSAHCSRSLGELSHARAFTALAAAALPGSTAISSLADQLDVEAPVTGASYVSSNLRTTSSVLSAMVAASSVQTVQQQQENEDNNDQSEQQCSKVAQTSTSPVETETFWRQVATLFQTLEETAHSTWLEKLERVVHQHALHCCASPEEVRQLDTALQNALSMLSQLMQSSVACSVLGLDMADEEFARTLEKLAQANSSTPQTLVQNRTARNWIVQTWAPAVQRATNSISDSRSVFIDLSHDLLLVLARLLQVSGSWRRCTVMAHCLAYAEMSHNLAKSLRSDDADAASWSRLELQCAEAHGAALLQRISGHNDALKIFRESLQAAVHSGDHECELRARLHITKTLRLMEEPEVAHAELVQLLARSRALNDVYAEAMTQYELGEHFVQIEDVETAQEHFRAAQTLCNRTANCGKTWRPRSIQQAIAFYARLQPLTRRGAMRCSVSSLFCSVNDEDSQSENDIDDDEEEEDEEEEEERPKSRRQAFCVKNSSPQHRSVLSSVMSTTTKKPKRTLDWRSSVCTTRWSTVSDKEFTF